MQYLDELSLAKLRSIHLRLSHPIAEGQLSGLHKSKTRGFSQEFAHHRAYVPGDELKFIDWKVYARKDRFYIKQYQEEKNLRTTLVLDASGSMGFGEKWDYACHLTAALGYLALFQGDAIGLAVFDTQIRAEVPARRQMQHLETLDQTLSRLSPRGETQMEKALHPFLRSLPKNSHLIFISDLWEEPESLLKLFKALRVAGHEVWVLQVLDLKEKKLDLTGAFTLEDMETHQEIHGQSELLLSEYEKEFDQWARVWQASLQSCEIPFWTAFTHIGWEQNLLKFLSQIS